MDKIKSLANALMHKDSRVVVKLWNNFLAEQEKKGIKSKYDFEIKDMENLESDMNKFVQKNSFTYLINALDIDRFKTYENFWYENDINRVVSFNSLNDYFCPIDFEELAKYVLDTNSEIFMNDTLPIVEDFLYAQMGEEDREDENLFSKYLSLINEHIDKKWFITDDWDTLWKEISQLV